MKKRSIERGENNIIIVMDMLTTTITTIKIIEHSQKLYKEKLTTITISTPHPHNKSSK